MIRNPMPPLPRFLIFAILTGVLLPGNAYAGSNSIQVETVVDAPIAEVWKVWTTEEGLRSFFAPEVNMRLEVGGPFEIYFNPTAPEGTRGSEGSTILAFENESMLSFTWNAPPHMPEIRKHMTHVTVHFESLAGNQTKVTLEHDGWGRSDDWRKARDYFGKAWGGSVLRKLGERFSAP